MQEKKKIFCQTNSLIQMIYVNEYGMTKNVHFNMKTINICDQNLNIQLNKNSFLALFY